MVLRVLYTLWKNKDDQKKLKKAPNEACRESQAKWQNQKFCCTEKFKEKYAEHKYKIQKNLKY